LVKQVVIKTNVISEKDEEREREREREVREEEKRM